LKADWNYLWAVWLFELAPKDLGQWSSDKTEVTITSSDYISDLKSRPAYKDAIAAFKKQYPQLSAIKPGAILGTSKKPGYLFQFVGQAAAATFVTTRALFSRDLAAATRGR